MKPIMKLPVCSRENKQGGAYRLFEKSLLGERRKIYKKPDRTNTSKSPPESYLRNSFRYECFIECFQFQFNICLVQTRKINFASNCFILPLFAPLLSLTLIAVTVRKREKEKVIKLN